MSERQDRIVLTDIEGTIADIAFVRQVLFPYARRALPAFVAERADDPDVRAELEATARLAELPADDNAALVDQLCEWIDQDVKATPLKALQGMIWEKGYADGDYVAHLYADAYRWLAARQAEGVSMYVYSSGSIAAQDLYFRYNQFGDLRPWFKGFFDTTSGAKKEPQSYCAIARRIGSQPEQFVFFSDSPDELDAADQGGMIAVQLCRDELEACGRYPAFDSFDAIELEAL